MDRTDHSILIISGMHVKSTPFSFANAEDEKTFESFKSEISAFFLKYSPFIVDADSVSNDIITVLTADEELSAQVVDRIKLSLNSEQAVYETLIRLLPPENELKEENPPIHRNRRAVHEQMSAARKNNKVGPDQEANKVDADPKIDPPKSPAQLNEMQAGTKNIEKLDGNDPEQPFKIKESGPVVGMAPKPQISDSVGSKQEQKAGDPKVEDGEKKFISALNVEEKAKSSADDRKGPDDKEKGSPQNEAPKNEERVQFSKEFDQKVKQPALAKGVQKPPKPHISAFTMSAIKDAIKQFSKCIRSLLFHKHFVLPKSDFTFQICRS